MNTDKTAARRPRRALRAACVLLMALASALAKPSFATAGEAQTNPPPATAQAGTPVAAPGNAPTPAAPVGATPAKASSAGTPAAPAAAASGAQSQEVEDAIAAKLPALDQKIMALVQELGRVHGKARSDAEAALDRVRALRRETAKKLAELAEFKWSVLKKSAELKGGVAQAMADLEGAVIKADGDLKVAQTASESKPDSTNAPARSSQRRR